MKDQINEIITKYNAHFEATPQITYIHEPEDEDERELHILVYKKEDTQRECDVIITAGMSIHQMAFSADYSGDQWSCELIFYVDSYIKEDINWVQFLSQLPFIDERVIGYYHTIKYLAPLYPNSQLQNFTLLPPLVKVDQTLFTEGSGIELFWIVPLTEAEYEFARSVDVDDLLNLFAQNQHPYILDRTRKSYL